MDHAYIKEHSIVERYAMAKLSSAESTLFEEHFVDCAECQGQLQATQDFRQALQAANSKGELLPEFSPATRAGTFEWRGAFLAATACASLLFLSILFLAQHTRRLNRELSRASNDAAIWRQQYEAQRQANAQLQGQLSQAGEPTPLLPVVTSIFALNITRGGQPGDSEPANRFALSKSPELVVLSLDLDGNNFETYRATLKESGGRVVWKGESLTPASSHTLSIALPSSFLHQDDYSLRLEGLTRQGNYTAAGHYSFRVKR
jgi:hypothetical protein